MDAPDSAPPTKPVERIDATFDGVQYALVLEVGPRLLTAFNTNTDTA